MLPHGLTIALANSGRKWIGEVAHVAMLYATLEQLGHRPWIICRRATALEAHARAQGWRHLPLAFQGRYRLLQDWADLRAWSRWVVAERADVLHCHRGKDHWLGVVVARRTGRPLVRTRHVMLPVRRHPANRWLYLHATDAVLCVSEAVRAGFGPWQGRLPRGEVIHSAVDPERFDPARRSETWRREADPAGGAGELLWFGLVGRLQRIKGAGSFLEAAAIVARQVPAARFLIAGAGGPTRYVKLRRRAEELGLAGRLRLEGSLDELPTVLASLDVGVIASLGSEGFSRVAIEMMASGLPLAASAVGGIPELVGEDDGARLAPPGDAAALAAAMLAWAGDPDLRRAAGAHHRRRVLERHQPRAWGERVVAVYKAVLRPSGAPLHR